MASEQRWTSLKQFVGHTHPPTITVGIGILSVVLGIYAGWIAADFGLRTSASVITFLIVAVWLYRQRDGWSAFAIGLYVLAALIVLTPILFNLAFVLDAGRYGISQVSEFVLTLSNLIFFLVFVLIALIPTCLATLIRWQR